MRKLKLSGVIWIFAFVFILAGAFFAVPEAVEAAEGDVAINEANFPDANFRNYLQSRYDWDDNNIFTQEEIQEITTINIVLSEISSLQGIEHFTQLESLNCYGNSLTELDLSDNVMLTDLECGHNQIEKLNIENNDNLEVIDITSNNIKELDVSDKLNLKQLSCGYNQLTELDLSNNTLLEGLSCGGN